MFTFAETKAGYASLWDAATVTPDKKAQAESLAKRIITDRSVFAEVEAATGVPWYMVGCLLYRESDLSLSTYLGNGQPFDRVTTEVPAGRGPFATFQAGAIDALNHDGLAGIAPADWTIERVLYWCERFNGQGYFSKGGNSPYVWSWTSEYHGGKFVRDGVYDASTWDVQAGCAAILKELEALGAAAFAREAHADAPSAPLVVIPASPPLVAAAPAIAPAPAAAPLPVDQITKFRNFLLEETEIAAEVDAFKADLRRKLAAIDAEIEAFALIAGPPAPKPATPHSAAPTGANTMATPATAAPAALVNWKTSLAGVGAILGAVVDVIHQVSTGNIDPTHLMADWTAVTTGIGLIVAKDGAAQ
jgi:lysozyme family protein